MANLMKPILRDPDWFMTPFRRLMENFWDTEKFFDDELVRRDFMPAVNIKDDNKTFEIEVAAPGMKKEDFKVTVENGMLVIAAERKEEKEEKEVNYTRREFAFNAFRRTFLLPENVDAEKIEAKYDNGILHLFMKKTKELAPEVKQIKIL